MSRTSFAVKLGRVGGQAPLQYLTQGRMGLATEFTTDSLATVAAVLGDDFDATFSTSQKRVRGCSPRQHRQSCAVAC